MTREIPDTVAKAMADAMRDAVRSGAAQRGENFDQWMEYLDPQPSRCDQIENLIRDVRVSAYANGAPQPHYVTMGDSQLAAKIVRLFPEATS